MECVSAGVIGYSRMGTDFLLGADAASRDKKLKLTVLVVCERDSIDDQQMRIYCITPQYGLL